MDRIGTYHKKPYTKYRRNIELVTDMGWRKRSVHAVLEVDVTDAKKLIKKYYEKTGIKISFTGWIVKCVAETMTEYKEFNAYRHGKRKIYYFDDVDIAMPIEKKYKNGRRPAAYILRKANEKTILEITEEIRKAQKQNVDEGTQVLGRDLSKFEKTVLSAPLFIKKFFLWISYKNAILKKKHMGTTGVTAIGMKGKFPGWVVPLGGTATSLFVVGGITKKPGVVKDKIMPREFLHITLTADHDLVDGGPLARFIEKLCNLLENGHFLEL
jgi:pyruvate/2-oxoglutarate dehydrogenase complex dihydrolipoamide acyltransferase (E2) component